MTDEVRTGDVRDEPERWLSEGQALDGSRPCARCGQPFHPTTPTANFCTSLCRAKAKHARQAERKRPASAPEG